MDNNNSSGTNTILIVLLIALVVGALVWFMKANPNQPEENPGLNVDVNLPEGNSGNSEATE